jgi:conjugal transfer pilus assembly protein TrbC
VHFKVIYTLLLVFLAASADAFSAKSVHEATQRAKEYEEKIKLPDIDNFEAQNTAKRASSRFYSTEYQETLQCETERLKSEQFAQIMNRHKKPGQTGIMPAGGKVYIFVSSSVPLSTLRTYASELDRLDDPGVSMLLRGFVKGMKYFRPTLEFVSGIVVEESRCDFSSKICDRYNASISIDPLVFRKFGIESVPAVCYVRGKDNEGDPENLKGAQDAYIVYGDHSLERALEIINKETKSIRLSDLIRKLRGGFYAD